MIFKRRTREQRIIDGILKRVDRDFRMHQFDIPRDGWHVVNIDSQISLEWGGGQEVRVTLRRTR